MDDAERQLKIAEQYAFLSKSARERFDSRRGVEWKVSIGIWSLFGGAAGVTITSRTWAPGAVDIVVVAALALLVISIYGWMWIPWINEALRRDSAISYFWESAVQTVLRQVYSEHRDLPAFLLPPAAPKGDAWARFDDADPSKIAGDPASGLRQLPKRLHAAQITQIAITVAFVALLIGALISKRANTTRPSGATNSRFLLEGDVKLHGATTIKVGR